MTNIGITGHQCLDVDSGWQWLASILDTELKKLRLPLIGFSSLAIGADQLVASLILNHGGQIHVIIPFADYERTFTPETIGDYRQLLSKVMSVEVLETAGTDEDAYLAAGKRVVDLVDLMVGVWDGKPAKGKGGTADIVAYAVHSGIKVVHINPLDRTITQK